jgi:hypothetical protein
MRRKKQRPDLTAHEEELAELVLEVVDRVDAAPDRFQTEADALGATRNQFVAMAVARIVVERAGATVGRDLSPFEVGIAELVVDVLDRADSAPERIQLEAVAFGARPNEFIAVLLARFIVQKLAGEK